MTVPALPLAVKPAPFVPGRFRVVDAAGRTLAYLGDQADVARVFAWSYALIGSLEHVTAALMAGDGPETKAGAAAIREARATLDMALGRTTEVAARG